ncbi:chaplin [Streptomyces armeniacus]|uniref:Chaplin n=1 Tax=Streptomyces armeniacus TaxID=83291 RepID=A0A345XRH3_9ACTN|nr:chaplin [Streptomyces armeniacus]AXK34239.1 chaplin [Streptomyces armeniacus]
MKTAKKAVLVLAAAGVAAGASAGSALATGGHGHGIDGANAKGIAAGSPGLISGNLVQVPVHIPVNLCSNTVDVVGLLNPTFGNQCANL